MSYMALKHLHLLTIVISLLLFVTRGGFALLGAQWIHRNWIRIPAHLNDTVLLLAALGLCYHLAQWPFYNSAWLTAKVVGLVAYILLGTIAIKRGKLWAFALSLVTFVYIGWVAVNKVPFPGF